MKRTLPLVLLMLTAIGLRGQTDELANSLTVYTQFAQPPSSSTIGYMKTELEAIMQPFHRRLIWRSLNRADGHEVAAEIMVVNFKGVCRVDTLYPWAPAGSMLGSTHIVDGEILPFADVDCDRIRELLDGSWGHVVPAMRDCVFGRAMARVLAHELYHYLTRSTEHASMGIAKASYSAEELLSNSLLFDDSQLRKVLAAKPRHLAAATHRTAVAAE